MAKRKTVKGGARPGAGRKSREELGLPPVKNTTVQVEPEVIAACRKKHGSLANALRFAAGVKKVEKIIGIIILSLTYQ